MGWSSAGALGNAQNKAASSTVAFTCSQAVAAGQLVAIWTAWDAHGPSGGIGAGKTVSTRHSVTDSQGNIYVCLFAREDSTTSRPTGAIFVSLVRNALAIGDTITCTYANAVPVAKAIAGHVFNADAGMFWLADDVGPAQVFSSAVDPPSLTMSGLDSQEYLWLHVLGNKGPGTDAYTWDAAWTQITGDGTTGGLDTSNCQVAGGYKIATATSETVDVTSDTADRVYVQGMVAIAQAPLPTFPTTPILDDFNRADENPLDNGTWDATACTAQAGAHMQLISNEARGGGGSWWLTANAVNDAEVYVSMPTPGDAGLLLHGSGCGNISTRSAYGLTWNDTGGNFSGQTILFGQAGNSFGIAGGAGYAIRRDWASVTQTGLQKDGKGLIVWLNEGGGWFPVGGMYCEVFVRNSGQMALTAGTATPHLDDFGGGAHVVAATQHLLPILGVGA